MKGSEYFKRLQKNLSDAAMHKAVLAAAFTINSDAGERIFQEGQDAEGSQIGEYNKTKPLYVNPNDAPKKFPAKGKNGDRKFEDGKPHKTAYFDSYASYRKKVGRKTDKVNLVLFGNLQSDFVKGPRSTDTGAVITLTEENNEKRMGAEARYKTRIFGLTNQEREQYASLVVEQFYKGLNVK